ncbi:MAG: AAA-like domain-containing protein, partial [Candidatus Aminicenantes bacterium]
MSSGEKGNINMKSGEFVINKGEYYIRNEAAISEIIHNVRGGDYCTILGPPYCQKSFLLEDVKNRLQATGDEVCVLLDLQKVDFATDDDFLAAFAATLWTILRTKTKIKQPPSLDKVKDEQSLKFFIQNCVELFKRDLVLHIDHLERIRIGPLKSLLLVLRAIYNERDTDAPHWLGVVTASSLSIAELSLGPTSPFNIARPTVVKDLNQTECEKLIDCILGQRGTNIRPSARIRLIQATGGDRYLIARLCNYCAELVSDKKNKQLTKREIEQAFTWFLNTEAEHHPPLLETIRVIEANPTALMNVLKILDKKQVPRGELELDLETVIDDLQLTGSVRV